MAGEKKTYVCKNCGLTVTFTPESNPYYRGLTLEQIYEASGLCPFCYKFSSAPGDPPTNLEEIKVFAKEHFLRGCIAKS